MIMCKRLHKQQSRLKVPMRFLADRIAVISMQDSLPEPWHRSAQQGLGYDVVWCAADPCLRGLTYPFL